MPHTTPSYEWDQVAGKGSVKTQSSSLFFSCSTLEPNTEVFSKVSQSLALVNSVSTLLNKGGIACSRPTTSQDFYASAKQTRKCTTTLFQPCIHDSSESEGRRAVTAAEKASKQNALLQSCRKTSTVLQCSSQALQHAGLRGGSITRRVGRSARNSTEMIVCETKKCLSYEGLRVFIEYSSSQSLTGVLFAYSEISPPPPQFQCVPQCRRKSLAASM